MSSWIIKDEKVIKTIIDSGHFIKRDNRASDWYETDYPLILNGSDGTLTSWGTELRMFGGFPAIKQPPRWRIEYEKQNGGNETVYLYSPDAVRHEVASAVYTLNSNNPGPFVSVKFSKEK